MSGKYEKLGLQTARRAIFYDTSFVQFRAHLELMPFVLRNMLPCDTSKLNLYRAIYLYRLHIVRHTNWLNLAVNIKYGMYNMTYSNVPEANQNVDNPSLRAIYESRMIQEKKMLDSLLEVINNGNMPEKPITKLATIENVVLLEPWNIFHYPAWLCIDNDCN